MAAIDVFISSSFHDEFTLGFAKERAALKVELGKDPELNDISLDYGDPQDRGSVEESILRVKKADLVVLFVGTRYGGIVEDEGISLTHLEYRKAMELKKSMLIYIFPQNIDHKEYIGTDVFIEEIENDNKKIYAEVEKILSKYKYDVLACKAGGKEEDEQLKEKKELYFDALALKITNDISKLKNKLQSKLPFGVKEIKEDDNEKLKYNQYLSNKVLPYVPRSEFKQIKNISDDFESEIDLYEKVFFEDSEYDGLVLSGEGGVGKTRLMLELGRIAQRNEWVVYQIYSDFEGWDTLRLDENKKYCFLFDYIEENSYFDANIFRVLTREYNDMTIKIVANARNTYFINNSIRNSSFYRLNIDNTKHVEKLYLLYVIENIFKKKNIDLKNMDLNIHEIASKPSFAVFLIQGLLKGILINLHDVKDFNEYITRRLALTFGKKTIDMINNDVFRILFFPSN